MAEIEGPSGDPDTFVEVEDATRPSGGVDQAEADGERRQRPASLRGNEKRSIESRLVGDGRLRLTGGRISYRFLNRLVVALPVGGIGQLDVVEAVAVRMRTVGRACCR